ncbi:ABC transporter permease [Bacillus rubiinfantis]|uniref:ABC transporter permease n=1 Tax=Bacillus rubiinfantis TaxID=1499680 RepID=UPI0005A6764B|nr:ABC transporter permease [Bacillus rubiinfantis]
MINIWFSEWKTFTRQRSFYAFLLLWIAIFSLLFLLQKNNSGISDFTNITATIVTILLYLLPLFMTINGSFSIANELENGQWRLLCTYPLSTASYLGGKFLGMLTSQLILFTLSYGLSMLFGLLTGASLSVLWLMRIYLFSLLLIFAFLLAGIVFGTFVKTKWQAFTISVIAWFFGIMIWPTALITVLGLIPYPLIESSMKLSMFLNPAEFFRVFLLIRWDSGAVFGQSYDSLVRLFESGAGIMLLIVYLAVYFLLLFAIAAINLERRRMT